MLAGIMFPLHCNHCFRRYKLERTTQFSISRCGHIMCQQCQQDTCPKCSKPFTGVVFNKDMPSAMIEYFRDPLDQFRHFQKIIKFQNDQENCLVEHLREKNNNKRRKVKEYQLSFRKIKESLKQTIDKERERIRKYREYIAYYERRSEQMRYMTPPITAQPRPRYPARKIMSNPTPGSTTPSKPAVVDYMPQFTQTIRASFPAPHSPTVSTNDGSSGISRGMDMAQLDLKRKTVRTPPPFLPCSEFDKVKTGSHYPKYGKIN